MPGPFPITPLVPRIRASLAAYPRLVLTAPPGAGKTTQVPPALLDAPWLAGRQVVLLEPRRIAARAAAAFMAAERDEAVGQTVGYRIRFETRVSAATRILVVTEGILTRMLQDDPELPAVGAIIFDEFHERHLAGDLGAALALDVQAALRPDLRLIVMSATLDDARIAPWFDAPVLRSEGRAFPVRVEHPPARRDEPLPAQVGRSVQRALSETNGDVLVFLPGRREIAQTQRMLQQTLSLRERVADLQAPGAPAEQRSWPQRGERHGWRESGRVRVRERAPDPNPRSNPSPEGRGVFRASIEILPLHGELSMADQQAALTPAEPGTRRVILATNVAESSITVPGIRAVVDGGLAREPRFDPNSGLTRLATISISQASAEQRAGRAGRVAPGVAYRLWPESQRLEPARTPEIAQVELSGLALELAAWGIGADIAALHWLDPPPAGALAQARELLQRLGALDTDLRITPAGRALLQLGTTPRLAAAAQAAPHPLRALVADLLAILEARSPLRGAFNDDLRVRIAALHRFRDGGARAARDANAGALAAIEQAARGWRKRLDVRHAVSGAPNALSVGNLLLHAFPDRVARRDADDPRRYLLANGHGARLHEASVLFGEPWLIVAEARFDARDSLILAAAPFDPALLVRAYPRRIVHERRVRQNASGTVEAFEVARFDAIVMERKGVPPTADDALPALLATIRAHGIDALPWTGAARQLRQRIAWLHAALPETNLPEVSDAALLATLESWLAPTLYGKRKLGALTPAALSNAFASLLDYRQRQLLDTAAPEAITVPSGRAYRLDYNTDAQGSDTAASPVLAVKLQELFGLAETPRVAHGRMPVTLHLLSPAGRPIQVTQDLRGFWDHTYAEVKKELKGRYPRHPWPDDPWNAVPTHRTKRRS
ncbi:MAG: ATP-dependent helicase HrpB [Rhodanobacteraceae bacterium]|nr:MAG: ATP-dependent helicase HrpB [Rhodanobacteraceae bacterium]